MDCIECLPKGLDMLDISMSEKTDLTQKLRMYSSIADHYKDAPEPLWSSRFLDLQLGLLNLIMQNNADSAVTCLQLCMVLLPSDVREELKRLLNFLHQVSISEDVRISSSVSKESV